ncbi:molybdate ABC transporter substrate-binding protein [Yoonia maricola]|nr:molybdate ABC transporter substrate-binding protein [Yoonia maricola]
MALILTQAALAARAEVLIFAAASLKEPIDQIAEQFDDVVVSYGGSGTLARQVTLGAPADIVLLANTEWMDVLVAGGHVEADSVVNLASNRLVLIGPQGTIPLNLEPDALRNAIGNGRFAVGLTEAVPAGIYAKEALQHLDLWEAIQDRLAEVDNVRAALTLVARGQTPLGIVYRTDTRISDDVAEVAVFPLNSHRPIQYLGALTDDRNDEARMVLDVLTGVQGQAIFAASGFLPPTGNAK